MLRVRAFLIFARCLYVDGLLRKLSLLMKVLSVICQRDLLGFKRKREEWLFDLFAIQAF
jgi:hypothetical protein